MRAEDLRLSPAEISENVDRGNLTPARRRELIRQFVALLREHDEMLDQISRRDVAKLKTPQNPKGAGRPKTEVAVAAEKFGVTKRAVQRALAAEKPKPIVDHLGRSGRWGQNRIVLP